MLPSSPLAGYLSHGDVITAVDGSRIYHPSEWIVKMIQINSQMLHKAVSGRKAYCIPNFWLDGANSSQVTDDNFSCPDELASFVRIPCLNSSLITGISSEDSENRRENKQCLMAKDVVKLKKCVDGGEMTETDRQNCACLEVYDYFLICILQDGFFFLILEYSLPFYCFCKCD